MFLQYELLSADVNSAAPLEGLGAKFLAIRGPLDTLLAKVDDSL